MDGIHDLGGRHGFGPIDIETNEPVFHHDWEKRVFAMAMAAPFVTAYCDDQLRRKIEQIAPQAYLESSYYELWLEGMIALLKELAVISDAEIDQGRNLGPLPARFDPADQAKAEDLKEIVAQGESQAMSHVAGPHRFKTGDPVVTRARIGSVHTRLPQYARGKAGRVIAEHGIFIFADSNSVGQGADPQMLYTVEFEAQALWGSDAKRGDSLCLDLWDAYLEPQE